MSQDSTSGTKFDFEVYGHLLSLLEAWFNYGASNLNEVQPTAEQRRRLHQLTAQLSLAFTLAHHNSPILAFIAAL